MALLRKKKMRTCVIGLDGVPYSLITRFTDEGVMPAVRELSAYGSLHKMSVTLPEISAVSWPSFMTGTGPGGHGIFGFVELKPGTYDVRYPNYADLKAPTIWDKLRDRGKRSVVINQPGTYPMRPLEGSAVAGFVAIDIENAVYPPALAHRLGKIDYEIDIDIMACREDHDLLQEQLLSTLRGRREALDLLWDEDWDYLELVVTGTDRLHHFLWDAVEDADHPRSAFAREYYGEVDRLIGYVWERFGEVAGREDPADGFFMMSDHGFTGITREVNLNAWLVENGYLSFETAEPKSLSDIAPESRAFALDPSRIYINRKGKYPKGTVTGEDAPKVVSEIKSGLSGLDYLGAPVVNRIFERNEVYDGPYAGEGPDIILISNYGFDLKAKPDATAIFDRTVLAGMHTWDDAFFWSARDPAPAQPVLGPDLNIVDLSDIILGTL
ncbi:MAG: alkaline phosphatase family protein [Candidatus Coatesbacteria bacterium]|nr:MAG: alkaline phosphatase family protein [Candidatus Coatesbacteria bacterium]